MRVDWGLFLRRLGMLFFCSWLLFQMGRMLLQVRKIKRETTQQELRFLYLEAERGRLLKELRRFRTLEGKVKKAREEGYFDPRKGERVIKFVEVRLPAEVSKGWHPKER